MTTMDDRLSNFANKSGSLFPGKMFNTSIWERNTNTTTGESESEDLTVMGVVIFLIRWWFGVIVEVGSLIPQWILITIGVVIFVRYMLMPSVRLVVGITETCCFLKICFICDYMAGLTDVRRTRAQLSRHMIKVKAGVWINEADSDDEIKYQPFPEEEELIREANYELANIVDV